MLLVVASTLALATLAISRDVSGGNQPSIDDHLLVEQGLTHARSLGDLHASPVLEMLTVPPASPVAPPASPSSQPILVPLAGALIQCVCLILIGYWCKRAGLFSAEDARGLSAFVGRLSLPALLFLSMATLDIQMIDTLLLCTILLVKGGVFLLVVISCRVTDGLELTPDDTGSRRPESLAPGPSDPQFASVRNGAPTGVAEPPCRVGFADPPLPPPAAAGHQSWLSRAGLYAIFATQSNDFALGLPLIRAIWGSEMTPVVFLVPPSF